MEKGVIDASGSKPTKKMYDWWFVRLKANKRGAANVFTCLTAWAKVLEIHLAVTIPEKSYIYSI